MVEVADNKHAAGDSEQALALGYVRLPDHDGDATVFELHQAMHNFAASHGLRLTRIFFEFRAISFDALDDLIAELRSGDMHHLIVPTLEHFAETRALQNVYLDRLETQAGADVLELTAVEH